jgi:hypothetical protein
VFEDFARPRIEELYEFSHSRKHAWFKQIVLVQQSVHAVLRFFDSEKVEAYLDRAKPVQWELVTSVEVGALIAELYVKDRMFAADDPQLRLIKALQLVDGCGNADADHSDDDRGEGGVGPHYAATISSRATFLQVVELVKSGLSYRQVAEVMSLYRAIFSIVHSTRRPMTRQLAAQYVRIFAASRL